MQKIFENRENVVSKGVRYQINNQKFNKKKLIIMGLFTKEDAKSKAVDFAKDELQDAVEDKVADVVAEKTLDYAIENAGSTFLPWWVLIVWWPIKQIALLITWPIRILFKKKK